MPFAKMLVLASIVAALPAQAQPRTGANPTFYDDFSHFAASADGIGHWMTQYPYTGRSARSLTASGLEYYSDTSVGTNPFAFGPAGLDIQAQPGPNVLNLPYVSGLITTFHSFSQTYGVFEMRAQVPAGRGLWPAFWLLPLSKKWPPEIDVMEVLGREPTKLYVLIHDRLDGQNTAATVPVTIPDASQGFHTYAVDWEPDQITWYFDGNPVASQPTSASLHAPMFMLINLGVGGKWPGFPDAATPFPAHYRIAYVRAYASPSAR